MHFRSLFILCYFVFQSAQPALSEKKPVIKSGVDLSLFQETRSAAVAALQWFKKNQMPQGNWSNPEHPAITALVLRAFLYADKVGISTNEYDSTITRGFTYLVSCVKQNGGIYVKGYENYNTAISLIAFLDANKPEYREIIIRANNFLVGMQMGTAEKGDTTSPFDGGIGYNKDGHSDMNNTTWSLEALYLAKTKFRNKPLPDQQKISISQEMKDLNWEAAIGFISRCQNLTATNKMEWASDDSVNKGGFVYYPGNSKSDPQTVDGKSIFPSYGTMSLAGIMALLFSDVPKSDIRIQQAYKWLQRNYTLEENPGLGKQGIYFYYYIMAKSLKIYGNDTLTTNNKTHVLWRKKLLEKLVNLQKKEGFWVNENGRWWENDPVLTTAYALMAAEISIP